MKEDAQDERSCERGGRTREEEEGIRERDKEGGGGGGRRDKDDEEETGWEAQKVEAKESNDEIVEKKRRRAEEQQADEGTRAPHAARCTDSSLHSLLSSVISLCFRHCYLCLSLSSRTDIFLVVGRCRCRRRCRR